MAMLVSTACILMQRPGAEEFGCLSVVLEPLTGRFSALPGVAGPEYVDPIGLELGEGRRATLTSLLLQPVDSRIRTLRRAARLAARLPLQATLDDFQPVDLSGCFPSEGGWMVRPPDASGPSPLGPPLLSQYTIVRPDSSVRLVVGCRGLFLPTALEPPLQSRRSLLQQQLPAHLRLLDLEVEGRQWPTSMIDGALRVAAWQSARLYG